MTDEKHDIDDTTTEDVSSKGNVKDAEDIHFDLIEPDDDGLTEIGSSSTTPDTISELEKEMIELRKEKEDMYDRLLRKHADFENYRKRIEKDKREFQEYALTDFMVELIVILDNFERALSHSDEQSGPEYRKGIELIYRQLRDAMEKKGLRPIRTTGEAFDPNFHEAIAREERNDLPENTILEELIKGYFFRDKLLRPAMVKVSFQSNQDDNRENASASEEDQSGESPESGDGWDKNES